MGKHRYCDGIILSETKIATWNCKINPNGTLNKVSIFTNRKTVVKDYYFKLPEFATRKIQRPSWKHLDGYDILQLDRPLKISAKKAPICIAKSVTDIDSPDKVAFRFERLDKKRLHQPFRDDFYTYSTVNKLRIAKESKLNCIKRETISKFLIIFLFKVNTVRGHAITYKSRKDGKWYFAGVEQRNVLVKQTNKLAQRIFVC